MISNGGISQLPSAIIQPSIGLLGALSNLALGLRNTVDKNELEIAKEKYKTNEKWAITTYFYTYFDSYPSRTYDNYN